MKITLIISINSETLKKKNETKTPSITRGTFKAHKFNLAYQQEEINVKNISNNNLSNTLSYFKPKK